MNSNVEPLAAPALVAAYTLNVFVFPTKWLDPMQSFGLMVFRVSAYVLFIVGVAHLVTMEGYDQLSKSEYREASVTEYAQELFAFLSCTLFLVAARLSPLYRPAALLLGALTAMMLVRELDAFLDEHLFDGAWKALVAVVTVVTVLLLSRRAEQIKPSILHYSREPSSGVLFSGLLVTLVFSRLFGRGDFWEAVMGDKYMRLVKNIVEEGTELMGYALVLIAAFELLASVFRSRQKNAPTT